MSDLPANGRSSLIPAEWDVPAVFRSRLGRQAGRQRCMSAEGHLLLVLHEPPQGAEISSIGRFFWRQPDGSWTSNGLGDGIEALEEHLDQYDDLIEVLEQKDIAARTADQYFSVVEELIPMHRSAENLHLAVQSARESCPDDRRLIDCRDQAYEIVRSADLLLHDSKAAMDYAIAKRAEEQSRYSHELAAAANRLSSLVAFFLPIGTLSAVFGMNVLSGLEHVPAPLALIGILLAGLAMGFGLKFLVINRPVPLPSTEELDRNLLPSSDGSPESSL